MRATIQYDLNLSEYVVIPDDDSGNEYTGKTVEEAVAILRHQYNKHELWPNED